MRNWKLRIRKIIIIPSILLTTIITTSYSQDYKKFEWDVLGISLLMPAYNDIGNAIGFYSEARFNVNDKISVGVNYNWQFFDELFDEPIRGLGITTSYSLAGEYYVFNNYNKRAFAGFAIGSFNNAATTESGENLGGTGLGIIPRIGYEFEFLRLMAKYNHTFKKDFPNYFSIGLGLTVGGRKK